MTFTSYAFLPLLALSAGIHRVLPGIRSRNAFLLLLSLAFYASFGLEHLLFLAACVGITYGGGLLMDRWTGQKRQAAFVVALGLNLALLAVFKYAAFAVSGLNAALGLLGRGPLPLPRLLLPVGLSFLVFQSSTYLLDLKAGRLSAERNLLRYALFVAFFPTLVSGPIQRASRFLPLLRERKNPSFAEGQSATVLFLWGLFLKMVIADRIAMITDPLFADPAAWDGALLLCGALLYGLQIYLDFAGYSFMAIAAARLFGFRLGENFHQPYLATTIADFWRRWHISLTGWFTDYVYIPLGGNRRGALRRYLNILIVFLLSGLWHGANWTFVVWGLLHAVYQIFGHVTRPARQALLRHAGIPLDSALHRLAQRGTLYLLSAVAWVFFRCESLAAAGAFLRQMVTGAHPSALLGGSLAAIGPAMTDWKLLAVFLLIALAVSLMRESGLSRYRPESQSALGRSLLILALFAAVLVFGAYGEGFSAASFIYAGF